MPTGMFGYRDEGERRAIERAVAFVAETATSPREPRPGKFSAYAKRGPSKAVVSCCGPRCKKPCRRASRPRRKKRGGAPARAPAAGCVSSDAAVGKC